MLRQLYYRFRHGPYLKNAHGIKKFAERAMGQLIRKVTKKSAFYREQNENLLVEKANLRLRADELQERPMLDAGEFFSMRRRLRANTFIVVAFVLAALFLNMLSVAPLIQGDAALPGVLRWIAAGTLAAVLTGGGLIVAERLIETLYPGERTARVQTPSLAVGALWGLLLVGLELAILGLADIQASRLAGGQDSFVLYVGFVALAMLLPVIAGAVRWDAMRYLDVYKTTQSLRDIESRLAQIDSILRQNEEYESNFYKVKSITYWDRLNEFKTIKDNYNERYEMTEALGGHFAQAYDAFQKEAGKRYGSDIRDVRATSIRKLDRPSEARPAGNKLGQMGKSTSTLRPAASAVTNGNGHSSNGNGRREKDAGTYQELQPVR